MTERHLVDVQVTATCRAVLDETWHVTVPADLLAAHRRGEVELEELVAWSLANTPATVTVEEESHDETDREFTGLVEPPLLERQLAMLDHPAGAGREDPL